MFKKNIGKEFYKQMNNWFNDHPEVEHQWNESELKINYPKELNKFITFHFDSKKIKIKSENVEKIFFYEIFTSIGEQVLKIRSFWINELLTKEETDIFKPKLKENQIAIMFCNAKYGQVLTTNKNVFTGWGNVYQVFENEEQAKNFIEIESESDKVEISAYTSKYEYIDIMKKS